MNAYALPQLLDVSPVWRKELAMKVKARFPSWAELGRDVNRRVGKLILHPAAAYVMRTSSESMVAYVIFDGDIAAAKCAWGMKQERRRRANALCWENMPVFAHRLSGGRKGGPL